MDRYIRYVESALMDAKRQGLAAVTNPATEARRVYSTILGMLLQAKIRNDLRVLQDLAPAIRDMIGVRKPAAEKTSSKK